MTVQPVNLDAVLFDLDGVLVDSKEVWFRLMAAAARNFGGQEITPAAFEASWGQSTAADVRDLYPGRTVAEVDAYYHRHFTDYTTHITVNPEAAGVLAALHGGGVRTAVVTNTAARTARDILARAGLAPRVVVGGSEVAHPKPAPDMVRLALERLGVAPERALMVGDTDLDRQAAAAAGVRFAGYIFAGDVFAGDVVAGKEFIGAAPPGDLTLAALGEVLQYAGLSK